MSNKYIYWWFKNLFTLNEIKKLNKKIKDNIVNKEDNASSATKTAKVLVINPSPIKELDKFFKSIYESNKDNFGFDLYDYSLEKQNHVNYNKYSSKDKAEYQYHTDGTYSHHASDIKLTAILNLSLNKYEGGDFYINPFGQEEVVDCIKTPGNLLIFPSWFLHKVTPVTKGERISLSTWIKGPKFK
tara:strand:+ start:476 stop:1033 length:558 start_codon:yes stop_codon:yes gene_type:complete